jgi:hypothetical protein
VVPDPVCEPDLFERLTLLTSNGRRSASGRFFLRPHFLHDHPLSQPRHDGMADLRHPNHHNREIVIKS